MTFLYNPEEIIRIGITAGKAILEVYYTNNILQEIHFKADNSPLTIADGISNDIISKALINLYPHIPIISEEGKDIPFEKRKDWDYFWLIDPLDGTKEFLKRNGEFTVNIALIFKNSPIAGFIYIPVQDIFYYGEKGKGSFKLSNQRKEQIRVSSKSRHLIAVGSRSHATDKEKEFLKSLPVNDIVTAGSSIKFCMVAEGSADIYYREGPTMEWDTAAGHAILEAAGGKISHLTGLPFLYNKGSLLNQGFLCNGSSIII